MMNRLLIAFAVLATCASTAHARGAGHSWYVYVAVENECFAGADAGVLLGTPLIASPGSFEMAARSIGQMPVMNIRRDNDGDIQDVEITFKMPDSGEDTTVIWFAEMAVCREFASRLHALGYAASPDELR